MAKDEGTAEQQLCASTDPGSSLEQTNPVGFARWFQPKALSTDWELGILHLGGHQIQPWRSQMGKAQPATPKVFK